MTILYFMRSRPGPTGHSLGPDLSMAVFEKIATAIEQEKHLLPTTARDLRISYLNGLSVVVLKEGEPIGHTRLQLLTAPDSRDGSWYELGSTWVHPEHRGNGINPSMYGLLLSQYSDGNILATTTNQNSLAVGERLGFVQITRQALPWNVWNASCCCPASKTGTANNRHCFRAFGEAQLEAGGDVCWFRVTSETAARLRARVAQTA